MALLEDANLLGNKVFVFKKGMASNWTWGVLDCVDDDEYEFSVTDPWKDGVTGQKQFCMAGDCGSIVFGTLNTRCLVWTLDAKFAGQSSTRTARLRRLDTFTAPLRTRTGTCTWEALMSV
jgi:hypothetical protein